MSKRVLNSVWGVLKVLQQFAFNQEAWGPRELARTTGLSKSTALRILQTMVDENFLINSEKNDKYMIGPELWHLGLGLRNKSSLSTVVVPILNKYVHEINETFHFFRHNQGKVIFDQVVECSHELRYLVTPGVPYEIEKGAAGKVILAFLPARETQKLVGKLKKDSTRSVNELLKKVTETKEKGYSFTIDERGSGVVGFAAPILGPDNALLGGIGLAIPVIRYRSEDHKTYADLVRACAGEISFLARPDTGRVEKGRRETRCAT